jgi:hypothetical protein
MICGSIVQWFGFFSMYLAGATFAAIGLIITFANRKRLK